MKKYKLIDTIETAKVRDKYYIYDANQADSIVLSIPTQSISRRLYEYISIYQKKNPNNIPKSLEAIEKMLPGTRQKQLTRHLIKLGYLEEKLTVRKSKDRTSADRVHSSKTDFFTKFQMDHFFCQNSFFQTPEVQSWDDLDVGIIGVPICSERYSAGTIVAPQALRRISQKYCFFEIFERGVYSEAIIFDGLPGIICKDVVFGDLGDIDVSNRRVCDLFSDLETAVYRAISSKTKLLIIGGDHSMTFPSVDAYVKHLGDVCLIHLDAHSDRFYSKEVRYSHAATIGNLINYTKTKSVLSFGLRTYVDSRTEALLRPDDRPDDPDSEFPIFNLQRTKKIFNSEELLREQLRVIGDRPTYITIDLDVLSANANAARTSTPTGEGLEWYELYEFIRIAFDELNVVACDVVEYNEDDPKNLSIGDEINALLLLLINGLSKTTIPNIQSRV